MKWFAQIVVENFITIVRQGLRNAPPPASRPTHAVSGQLLGLRSKVCYTSLIADAVFIYQSVLTSPRTDCCRQATINQFKLKSDGYWTGTAGCCIGLQHPSFSGAPFRHWTALGSLSGMQSAFLIWKIEKHLSILSHQFSCLSLPLSVCLVVSLRPACFASFLPHTHTHRHSWLSLLLLVLAQNCISLQPK